MGYIYIEKKRKHKSQYKAGGVLKNQLKERYLTIAQDFDYGSFNAYYMLDSSKKKSDISNYKLGLVTIEESVTNTIGEYFRKIKEDILFIDLSKVDTKQLENIRFHFIGAKFFPAKINNNQTSAFWYGIEHYDTMILIKESTATKLLDD